MKILLISYTFPPTPGIGGRRWAKFAKYLTKDEHEFHVIHSNNSVVEGDFWMKDVANNPKIKTYPIPFRFNKILANSSPNLFQKIAYRPLIAWAKKSKYSPFDNTSFSRKRVVNLASGIIQKEGIDILIVTGPPQNTYHFSCDIKKRMGVKVVLDYRDLWNGHPTYSVFQEKSKKQLDYALKQEKEGLSNADMVLAVNEGLKKELIKLNGGQNPEKFQLLVNCFDKDDFYLDIPRAKNEKIRMFFAGNVAKDSVEIATEFIQSYKELKAKNLEVYNKFQTEFYIKTNDPGFLQLLKKEGDEGLLVVDGFLPKEAYYKKLRSVDVGIMFLTETYSDAFITKFSDFIVNENYLLQVGYEGDFSAYISNHKIGLTYHLGDGPAFFEKLADEQQNAAYSDYSNADFDVENIAQKLNSLLNEVV